MIGYRVRANGELVCTAGIENHCVLTLHVTHVNVVDPGPKVRKSLDLSVGGLDSAQRQHLSFAHRPLQVGDRVEVEIVEGVVPDKPLSRRPQMTPRERARSGVSGWAARRRELERELEEAKRNETEYRKRLAALEAAEAPATRLRKAKKQNATAKKRSAEAKKKTSNAKPKSGRGPPRG